MEICSICMGSVFLPIELTSFECYNENRINCSSFHRVCRPCGHKYLQLDRKISERDYVLRCLFCPKLCHPRLLSFTNSFRKDFLLMNRDTQVYPCHYCENFSGVQILIDKHLETECPEFHVQCYCGEIIPRKDCPAHQSRCGELKKCVYCGEYQNQQDIHLHYLKAHGMTKCNQCHRVVSSTILSEHQRAFCSQRMVSCAICNRDCVHSELHHHLEEHLETAEQKIYACYNKLLQLFNDRRYIIQQLQTTLSE